MNILILSTDDGYAISIMMCLSKLKMKIYTMSVDNSHHVKESKYCSGYIIYDKNDLLKENDIIIDKINDYCKRQKIDVIIPSGIESTIFISKVRNRIISETEIFPVANWETLKLLNNKWSFLELMKDNGISCPRTMLITELCQIKSLDIEFPIMIKQLELDASRSVVKLNSFEELEMYLSKRNENNFNALPLLIQEYIPGIDMGINILAKNGKIIAYNMHKYYPNGVSRNVTEFLKDDNVLNIGRQIVCCCNFTGVANIDLRFDDRDKSIKVIECNPRFWGMLYASMFTGINFPYLGILIAQNKELPKDMNYKCVRYVLPSRLVYESIKKISLEDFTKENLYFIWQIIDDPLLYVHILIKLRSLFIKKDNLKLL